MNLKKELLWGLWVASVLLKASASASALVVFSGVYFPLRSLSNVMAACTATEVAAVASIASATTVTNCNLHKYID